MSEDQERPASVTALANPSVQLADGSAHDWSETNLAFRHLLPPKKLARLVRNAETVLIWNNSMGIGATARKTAMLTALGEFADNELLACTYDGLTLLIIGLAE